MTRRVVIADPGASPPVYPWRGAPEHLAARTRLRAMGLRPGRQGVRALAVWNSRRGGRPRVGGHRYADVSGAGHARPRIAMTSALPAALAARMTCPDCGIAAATSRPPGSARATSAPPRPATAETPSQEGNRKP